MYLKSFAKLILLKYKKILRTRKCKIIFKNILKKFPKLYIKFLIAYSTSAFTLIFTYPFDLARTILSIDHQYKYKSIENCLK